MNENQEKNGQENRPKRNPNPYRQNGNTQTSQAKTIIHARKRQRETTLHKPQIEAQIENQTQIRARNLIQIENQTIALIQIIEIQINLTIPISQITSLKTSPTTDQRTTIIKTEVAENRYLPMSLLR